MPADINMGKLAAIYTNPPSLSTWVQQPLPFTIAGPKTAELLPQWLAGTAILSRDLKQGQPVFITKLTHSIITSASISN
jgi:hypothetical protein